MWDSDIESETHPQECFICLKLNREFGLSCLVTFNRENNTVATFTDNFFVIQDRALRSLIGVSKQLGELEESFIINRRHNFRLRLMQLVLEVCGTNVYGIPLLKYLI